MDLILYQFPECPFCQRVLNTIDELNLNEKIELRNTRTSSEYRQELIGHTGMTQVPCLLIDGKPMLESLDIMNWLETNQEKI